MLYIPSVFLAFHIELYFCEYVCFARLSVRALCACPCLWNPEGHIVSPGTAVLYDCEPMCVYQDEISTLVLRVSIKCS